MEKQHYRSDESETSTWEVFRGDGEQRPGVMLPGPPPWRVFDTAQREQPRAVYRAYPQLVNAINVAITLRRPLLLTGPAGLGKSSVAEAIAYELGLGRPLRWNVTSQSTITEALYLYDALGRLQHQQLTGEDAIQDFLHLGPLGTALSSVYQRVLLIDEIDKGDIDLPGDLLNVLESGDFEIPELKRHRQAEMDIQLDASDDRPEDQRSTRITSGRVFCQIFPIIVITSNGEREFPPAFLRRCIRERIATPDAKRLADIVEAHLGLELAEQADQLIREFAAKLGAPDRPAALAIDQLLNTVLLMTRENVPTDPQTRRELLALLQKELRET